MELKKSPAAIGLVVVTLTVLGWVGCDGLSRMADRTADLLIEHSSELPPGSPTSGGAGDSTAAQSASASSNPQAAAGRNGVGNVANAAFTSQGVAGAAPIANSIAQRSESAAVNFRPYITIATFNIQVFSQAKLADRNVLQYLVDIVRQFDVVAIQEIRDPDQVALPYFVDALNAQGARFRYLVGPREGPADNQEQIAYVFNSDLVMPTGLEFVARDLQQRMLRNPYVVAFQCRRVDARAPFTFTLVAVNTNPQSVPLDLEAIADLLPMIRRTSPEDDLIVLGTFHAPPDRSGRLGQLPTATILVPSSVPTDTAKSGCWDNIGFDRLATTEFTQQYGVLDFAAHYRLSPEQATLISDHLPVWATFSIYESSPNVALQQPSGLR